MSTQTQNNVFNFYLLYYKVLYILIISIISTYLQILRKIVYMFAYKLTDQLPIYMNRLFDILTPPPPTKKIYHVNCHIATDGRKYPQSITKPTFYYSVPRPHSC